MKTATKTQNQRLLAYLRKHRKGITTMEAFANLGICRLSERIRELEGTYPVEITHKVKDQNDPVIGIIRTRETTPSGATVTRYKLAR
jgi:hypothetical protein